MAKRYRSDAFAAIHETMEALHDIGAIDKQTMREFDDACRTPVHVLAPEEMKAIRAREHISQPVFARYLNVSKNLVLDCGRGVKKPGGPALRLLTVIQKKGACDQRLTSDYHHQQCPLPAPPSTSSLSSSPRFWWCWCSPWFLSMRLCRLSSTSGTRPSMPWALWLLLHWGYGPFQPLHKGLSSD